MGLFTTAISPLGNHIRNIFELSSNKQMVRITARWIIATGTVVKRLKSIWDNAIAYLPANPVGASCYFVEIDTPISSVFKSACGPNPASIWRAIFVNLCPKVLQLSGGEFDRGCLSGQNCFSSIHIFRVNVVSDPLELRTPAGRVFIL